MLLCLCLNPCLAMCTNAGAGSHDQSLGQRWMSLQPVQTDGGWRRPGRQDRPSASHVGAQLMKLFAAAVGRVGGWYMWLIPVALVAVTGVFNAGRTIRVPMITVSDSLT